MNPELIAKAPRSDFERAEASEDGATQEAFLGTPPAPAEEAERGALLQTIRKMCEWLDGNPNDARAEARAEILRRQLHRLHEMLGWPSDTLADRRRLLDLAALNGYPAVPSLGIVVESYDSVGRRKTPCGEQSWICFCASACSVEDLRVAAAALRRL